MPPPGWASAPFGKARFRASFFIAEAIFLFAVSWRWQCSGVGVCYTVPLALLGELRRLFQFGGRCREPGSCLLVVFLQQTNTARHGANVVLRLQYALYTVVLLVICNTNNKQEV